MRKTLWAVATSALVLVSALSVPLAGAGSSTTWPAELARGQQLAQGEGLTSPSGGVRLALQTDGNLVEYGRSGRPIFSTLTSHGYTLALQADGNLVEYSGSSEMSGG